jgi:hypothetical protein
VFRETCRESEEVETKSAVGQDFDGATGGLLYRLLATNGCIFLIVGIEFARVHDDLKVLQTRVCLQNVGEALESSGQAGAEGGVADGCFQGWKCDGEIAEEGGGSADLGEVFVAYAPVDVLH